MINTKNLIKTNWGSFWGIGGPPKELEPLFFSLYNFNGINATELLDIGNCDLFQYLLVTEDNYLKARAKNMVIHLEWNYKGCSGKLPWNIAKNRAKLELQSIKEENFLKINQINNNIYTMGNYDRDLSDLNTRYSEIAGNLNFRVEK